MAENKNPFEIRLETLKMAKDMMDAQLHLQEQIMYQMIDNAKEHGQNIKEVMDEYLPEMYNPNKVVEKATEFYTYISKK
jgi:hypothetical protein